MTWLHIVYWIGCAIGILMFGASWLIAAGRSPKARSREPRSR